MSNTMSHMLDMYDPGLVGGFIGALIAMALGKFVEFIYMVHSCKKQVDSLDVLIRSVEPILMRIEGENDNVWSQEIHRARVSIQLEWETILLEWRTVSTHNVKALRHISKRSTHLISDIYKQVAQLAAAGAAAERLAQLVVAEGTAERGREERQRIWMQRLEDLDETWTDQRKKSSKDWLRWLDKAVTVQQRRMEESKRIWTEGLEKSARVWRGRLEESERVWMEKLGRLEELERVRMERLGWLEESESVWMQRIVGKHKRVGTSSSPQPPRLEAWDDPPSPSSPTSPLEFASEEKNPLSIVEEDEMPLQTLRLRGRGDSGGNRHGNQADTSAHSHLP